MGMHREGDWLNITMPTSELKTVSGNRPTSIAVCAADGACRWADAVLAGTQILVYIGGMEAPAEVRYCWGDAPVCNLYTTGNLPVAPFRMTLD